MRAFLVLCARLLLGLAVTLGWLAFAAVILLFAGERTGVLERLVLDALRGPAGSLADDVRVGSVRLAWFDPALEIDDLSLGANAELARLARVRVQFAFTTEHGFSIERVDARGGHVRIAPALKTALDGFSREFATAPAPGAEPGKVASGPLLTVRGIELDWETKRWGRLPIGRVDLDLTLDAATGPRLDGRLLPWLAPLPSAYGTGDGGVVTLRGRPAGDGAFDVRAAASGVPLSTVSIPPGTVLDGLVPWNPRGVLDLDLDARIAPDTDTLPHATARLQVRDGAFDFPGTEMPVTRVLLDVEARYAPASSAEILAASAWSGRAKARGEWLGARIDAGAVVGAEAGAGLAGKAWFAGASMPLEGGLPSLLAGHAREIWNSFEPRGRAGVAAAIELRSDWASEASPFDAARIALDLALEGKAGLTYHGWPHLPNGASEQGFPLPMQEIHGGAWYALDPRALRRFRIALAELSARQPSGPIRARGVIQAHAADAPPTLPGHGYAEIELQLEAPRLAVDEHLVRALVGLRGPLPPDSTWRPFAPQGGELGARVRLCRRVDMHWLATDVDLDLNGVALRWSELPVPVTDARGRLRFVSDGALQSAIAVSARAKLDTAKSIDLTMRMQFDPTSDRSTAERSLDELTLFAVGVERLPLVGQDTRELATRIPEIGTALALANSKGFVDASFERVRERARGDVRSRAEIRPAAGAPVTLQFQQFPMPTSDVHGRVLVGLVQERASGRTRARAEIAPIIGRWAADVQVAFTASFPEGVVRVSGAGIDPASSSLRGSIGQLLGGTPGAEADISGIGLAGRVDFGGELRLPATEGGETTSAFRIHLRENSFKSGANFALDGLRGVVVLENGELSGERLDARLADTPIELTHVGFRTAPDGFVFETDLAARGVPIDKRHLSAFADPTTIDALLDELKWRGTLDVSDGHVTLTGRSATDARLVFRGTVVPNDMFIVLGLPLDVQTAVARIEDLVLEGGSMRTRARVTKLSGTVAKRTLEDAEMLVTYHEPRLSIEDMTGKFAGGDLRPLGDDSDRGGTLFSIDLVEPYRYQLAMDLRAVKVEDLLQGLFVSNVASTGRLDCRLQLLGDQTNLLDTRGSGSVVLSDSYLWSVPVIRGLLETVGLGNSVTFDRMAANLDVRDGRVAMRDIRVRSAALQLAGDGTLDFDGTLDYELDVKLSEIENLQWLLRLVSWLTDNIVSVSIRGDLDRPRIEAHWFRIFGSSRRFRALPLPGYAPLPPRF